MRKDKMMFIMLLVWAFFCGSISTIAISNVLSQDGRTYTSSPHLLNNPQAVERLDFNELRESIRSKNDNRIK